MTAMRHWAEKDDPGAVSGCIMEMQIHTSALLTLSDDELAKQTRVFLYELSDISMALISKEITCKETITLVDARMDLFVKSYLEPWVLKNYGPTCVVTKRGFMVVGKA